MLFLKKSTLFILAISATSFCFAANDAPEPLFIKPEHIEKQFCDKGKAAFKAIENKQYSRALSILNEIEDITTIYDEKDNNLLMQLAMNYSESPSDEARAFLNTLLTKGVKINAMNKDKISALQFLALAEPLLVTYLQEHRFNFNAVTKKGTNLLMILVSIHKVVSSLESPAQVESTLYANVESILKSGFDQKNGYKNGCTPLHLATCRNDQKMMSLLISYGGLNGFIPLDPLLYEDFVDPLD